MHRLYKSLRDCIKITNVTIGFVKPLCRRFSWPLFLSSCCETNPHPSYFDFLVEKALLTSSYILLFITMKPRKKWNNRVVHRVKATTTPTSRWIGNETLVFRPMECYCEGEFKRFCVTPFSIEWSHQMINFQLLFFTSSLQRFRLL